MELFTALVLTLTGDFLTSWKYNHIAENHIKKSVAAVAERQFSPGSKPSLLKKIVKTRPPPQKNPNPNPPKQQKPNQNQQNPTDQNLSDLNTVSAVLCRTCSTECLTL